jgi:hypothetical protein
VCEPRVLFGVRSDLEQTSRDSNMEAWMWGGATTEQALSKFAKTGAWAGAPLPVA